MIADQMPQDQVEGLACHVDQNPYINTMYSPITIQPREDRNKVSDEAKA